MATKENELEDQLREVGSRLLSPPSAVDELLSILDKTESLLAKVEQSPAQSMSNVLNPLIRSFVAKELLRHSDVDVKVAVAACFSEITRITAPEAPYDDDLMKEIFQLIVQAFENLDDLSSRSFPKRVSMLETVAKVRSCVLMLDLECDALILEMFSHFLKTIRPNHSEVVLSSMEMIMTVVIEESEDISSELISCLLNTVKNYDKDILPAVRKLGEKVIRNCAGKLKPYFLELSQSVGSFSNDYGKLVDSICQESYGGIKQNDRNTSGEITESAKVEVTVLCPEEGTAPEKSLNSVKSNNISESTLRSSYPEHKPESSILADQSKTAGAADKDVSVKMGPKDVKQDAVLDLESRKTNDSSAAQMKIPNATQRKRGRFGSNLSASKQSVSALQERVAKVVDKSFFLKDTELKELDNEDCANIKQATVAKDLVEKSQRRRGRKGSTSKTNDEVTLQKLRKSKIKQHDNLKAQDDTTTEPVVKIFGIRTRKKELGEDLVGSKISVWWPMDKKFYDGVVDSYDNVSRKHKVTYIDGEVEILFLSKERWKLIKDGSEHDTEQIEDSKNRDASSEEPRRKRTKLTSTSISKEPDRDPTAKSNTASGSGHRRKGRPSKAASSNLHDTTSSSIKITESAASKSKDGSTEPGNKFKKELTRPKDGSLKVDQSSDIAGTEVKDNVYKSGRKSIDGSRKSVGRKVRRDSLKGKLNSDNSNSVLKIKDDITLESGTETMANIASGKGRVKLRGSEEPGKVQLNTTHETSVSDAPSRKKRKRKRRT
ncbi:uncharacterized protein LOC121985530 isoform X2 [Zingiber officinale]|uniref:uncharacterized protein LOC121985530 isoform X2 n=1 Tax=Zingiber officinale TaxID=94328 RepID=UPI001C4C8516|nr:uncharacterized protein LOC121985530 isoform X2 [Zingiber officinale]